MFPVLMIDDNLDQENKEKSRKRLKYLFSNSNFVISEFEKNPDFTDSLESEKDIILRSLNKAREINPGSNCFLLKDTSTTMFGPEDIYEILQYNLKDFDLLYLCRWCDSCNLYRNLEEFAGISIATTHRPQGFQAVMISPKVRDMILSPSFEYKDFLSNIISKMTYNRFLRAKTVVYNVFNFDMDFARVNSDYEKLNQCAYVVPKADSGINSSTYFFVGSLVALIVIAGVGLYAVGPKKTKEEN